MIVEILQLLGSGHGNMGCRSCNCISNGRSGPRLSSFALQDMIEWQQDRKEVKQACTLERAERTLTYTMDSFLVS